MQKEPLFAIGCVIIPLGCVSLLPEMIRTLSRLLYRAIIPPFLIALLVLTFVLFFEFIGSRSELLLSGNASLAIILSVAAAVLPGILIFSLPLAYLIGILIGFSGLSGESQITALRACGIPVRSYAAVCPALRGGRGRRHCPFVPRDPAQGKFVCQQDDE